MTTAAEDARAGELRALADALAKLPRELRRAVRPRLRAAGQDTMRAAAANASWSSRIPGALALRTSFTQARAGVTIVASQAEAPHARVYEGMVRDTFRHPVFGRRGSWVQQNARPYLRPAAKSTGGAVFEQISKAVEEAKTAAGL